jgi:hypothetical protein
MAVNNPGVSVTKKQGERGEIGRQKGNPLQL